MVAPTIKSEELKTIIDNLLEMKQNMPEMGLASKIKVLDEFIDTELVMVKRVADEEESLNLDWSLLDEYFKKMVIEK